MQVIINEEITQRNKRNKLRRDFARDNINQDNTIQMQEIIRQVLREELPTIKIDNKIRDPPLNPIPLNLENPQQNDQLNDQLQEVKEQMEKLTEKYIKMCEMNKYLIEERDILVEKYEAYIGVMQKADKELRDDFKKMQDDYQQEIENCKSIISQYQSEQSINTLNNSSSEITNMHNDLTALEEKINKISYLTADDTQVVTRKSRIEELAVPRNRREKNTQYHTMKNKDFVLKPEKLKKK